MEEPLVPLVMRLSGDDGAGCGLRMLQSLLQARKSNLAGSVTELHEALTKLSPGTHALGLCHILATLWSEKQEEAAFNSTLDLLKGCEAQQIQQCPVEFTSVTRAAVAYATRGHSDRGSEGVRLDSARCNCREQNTLATSDQTSPCSSCTAAQRLLKPLLRASQKFRKDAHEVTSSDADFLRLCVSGQWYKESLPVIDREAFKVNKDFCRSLKDCAEYFYLSGLVWIALEQYGRARRVLDLALSLPNTPEIIYTQISAYMRYALLSRMLHGPITRPPPPSPGVDEAMKMATYQLLFTPCSPSSRAKPGETVRDSNSSIRSLHAREQDLQTYAAQLKNDGTWDLAVIALSNIKRRQVKEIGSLFPTLPIDLFQTKMGFSTRDEALQFLQSDLVKAICRVDENLQMVTFNDDGEDAPEEDDDISPSAARKARATGKKDSFVLLKRQLDEALQQVASVTLHLHAAENQVGHSQAYQAFCRQLEALRTGPGFPLSELDSNAACFVPEGEDDGENDVGLEEGDRYIGEEEEEEMEDRLHSSEEGAG